MNGVSIKFNVVIIRIRVGPPGIAVSLHTSAQEGQFRLCPCEDSIFGEGDCFLGPKEKCAGWIEASREWWNILGNHKICLGIGGEEGEGQNSIGWNWAIAKGPNHMWLSRKFYAAENQTIQGRESCVNDIINKARFGIQKTFDKINPKESTFKTTNNSIIITLQKVDDKQWD